MTGSMYAAIAGLKTHMAKLNVIGNNIANVNTAGYKSQRVVFKDAMYQTKVGGSDGTTVIGGNNPSQIGYGVETSSIDIDMSTATFQTGKALDCMIDGDGFFLVGDKDVTFDPQKSDDLKKLTLTRVGDFSFDSNGYLVDGKNSCVYGFACIGYELKEDSNGNMVSTPIFSDQLVPLRIPIAYTQATADKANGVTGEGGNTPATQADGDTTTTTKAVVGSPNWPTPYQKVTAGTDNPTGRKDVEKDANGKYYGVDGLDYHDLGNDDPYCSLDSITIDRQTGAITAVVEGTDEVITIGYIAIGKVTNPNGVTHTGGPYYKAMDGSGDLAVNILGGVANDMGIEYVNGSSLSATADANNANSNKPATKMRIGTGGNVKLNVGGLEGSGADLATEITEMITTQRGYQANTRIITVTDSMLEELVNMKRS